MSSNGDDDGVFSTAVTGTQHREDTRVHLTTHDGDKGDDSGVAAIIRAMIRNPGGAVQIFAFIFGLYGVYYAVNTEIGDVKAAQIGNYEKLNAKLETITSALSDTRLKVDAVFSRGDTRYAQIITKLSAHDVDIAKLVTNSEYSNRQMDRIASYLTGEGGARGNNRGPEPRPTSPIEPIP